MDNNTIRKNAFYRMLDVLDEIKANHNFNDNWEIINNIDEYKYYPICFKVRNKKNRNLYFSVSTIKVIESNNSKVLETALWNESSGLVYDKKLGYNDVYYNDNTFELLNHLNDLMEKNYNYVIDGQRVCNRWIK